MGYFKELPNLETLNRTKNELSNDEVIIVKNFFKRPKIREDLVSVIAAFEYYSITGNERPEQIAERIYGDPELDWVILIANNITNLNERWPLDGNSFNKYMLDKYGSEEAFSEVHHYETISLTDSFNREVFPGGLFVDEAFYKSPEYVSLDELPPGITFPPIIIPGTLATASATVGIGYSINGIVINTGGAGYKKVPKVYISSPPITSNASAGCVINDFRVSSIVGLNSGQGYNTTPTVSISTAPTSVQATATCSLGTGLLDSISVSSIQITNSGAGYGLTAPTVTFTAPKNLIAGSYLNQSSSSVGSQMEGIYVRDDGVKFYSANIFGSNQIKEYLMTTPWDVTTLTFQREFDASGDFTYCTGVEFSPDGEKMFISGGSGGSYKVIGYLLSTPWDTSTSTKWKEISTTSPGGIRFKPDGYSFYFLDASNPDEIKQFTLTSDWDITTKGSAVATFNITTPTGDNGILGFSFFDDGKKMFATGLNNSSIYEFNLNTPWDISTAEYGLSFYVGDKITNPVDIFVRSNKEEFIVGGGSFDKAFRYTILSLAKGVAQVTNGSVSSIQISQPGTGYTVAPTITLGSPYPAVNATAVANVTVGFVTSITITNPGFGYTLAPTISIGPAPISQQASAVATVTNTGVSSIRIIEGGLNYVNPITITLDYPEDILNVEVDDTYSQNNKTWKWTGTEWKEKITKEFEYLDPTTNTIIKVPGNAISKPVTNYEYENKLNEEKRQIILLKPEYLSVIITDLRNMMKYDPESSTYINDNLKLTYNPKLLGV